MSRDGFDPVKSVVASVVESVATFTFLHPIDEGLVVWPSLVKEQFKQDISYMVLGVRLGLFFVLVSKSRRVFKEECVLSKYFLQRFVESVVGKRDVEDVV